MIESSRIAHVCSQPACSNYSPNHHIVVFMRAALWLALCIAIDCEDMIRADDLCRPCISARVCSRLRRIELLSFTAPLPGQVDRIPTLAHEFSQINSLRTSLCVYRLKKSFPTVFLKRFKQTLNGGNGQCKPYKLRSPHIREQGV